MRGSGVSTMHSANVFFALVLHYQVRFFINKWPKLTLEMSKTCIVDV